MKKNLLFASLFVAGTATAVFAAKENNVDAKQTFTVGMNLQDTTKPDTTKPAQDTTKPDSASFKF